MRYMIFVLLLAVCALTAAAAELTLTVADNVGKAWANEPIYWDIAFQPREWKGDKIAVTRDGAPIPAQATVTARHADGSVKTARVTLIIDALAKDAQTVLTATLNANGPKVRDGVTIEKEKDSLTLANAVTAVKLNNGDKEELSPILGVRTASGKWTGGGYYDTTTAKPVSTKTDVLEAGPIRAAARVTTTFDNGRTHVVTVSLLRGARDIDVEESFNVGPDDKYQYKQYGNDPDELAWEWWRWYGDSTDPSKDTHPNNWFFTLNSPVFAPTIARLSNSDRATDKSKTDRGDGYPLTYEKNRMEVFLEPNYWWQPDAVQWFGANASNDAAADVIGLCANRAGDWRNPNVLPLTNITLITRANAMRIITTPAKQLFVQCPIGLGARCWTIHVSTVAEAYTKTDMANTALMATNVQRDFGLDTARKWVVDWPNSTEYPRLFIKPADKEKYYARFKGVGLGMPGDLLNDFLLRQDRTSYDRLYANTVDAAPQSMQGMIDGYYRTGVNGYPGWMLGYWHGIVAAAAMDNMIGSPLCTPEQAKLMRKKMAVLTYLLTHASNWPDKQSNFGWGSMNMPVGRWGGLVVMASAISDHPMAKTWLKDADRYFRMLLTTEYAPDGTHISCPHYIGASSTSFYAWICLANAGTGPDPSKAQTLRNFARYYMQLMTPIDKRWGIRILNNEGDTRPGSSAVPGILATLFKESDPELAGQLITMWHQGGDNLSAGMGVPDAAIIDPKITPITPQLGPEVFPGFGAILRYRALGTPEEAYLSFVGGNFMIDHANQDQLAYEWYEKGVPLTEYQGDMYVPGAFSALSHNTICWNVRPEGPPSPGQNKAGDWYFDHSLPYVEMKNRPRLHLQIGWDQAKQKITDTRGMVTFATDSPGAALLEGQVKVLTLAEVPTRADYSTAMMQQIANPLVAIKAPFTWTRRLLYVKAPTAAGMNYLLTLDDQGGFAEYAPSISYWSLSNDVELGVNEAHCAGQLGIDTDLYIAAPAKVQLFKDSFFHTQADPDVTARGFRGVKQVVTRIEGQPGQGFLMAAFPRKADEPKPVFAPWGGADGMKIAWQGETHYVLLAMTPKTVDADGIKATAACLVVKMKDAKNYAVNLPVGGTATVNGQTLTGDGPVELVVENGVARKVVGARLLKP